MKQHFTRRSELRELESATNEERRDILVAKKAAFTQGLNPSTQPDRKKIFSKKNTIEFAEFLTGKKLTRKP